MDIGNKRLAEVWQRRCGRGRDVNKFFARHEFSLDQRGSNNSRVCRPGDKIRLGVCAGGFLIRGGDAAGGSFLAPGEHCAHSRSSAEQP